MKISIGTAQFGFNYGITNFDGKVKFSEIEKIIRFCPISITASLANS
tara:strand:- start:9 stop:149 length:141 start_codon:yes stop_codon:yes gene_type:complete